MIAWKLTPVDLPADIVNHLQLKHCLPASAITGIHAEIMRHAPDFPDAGIFDRLAEEIAEVAENPAHADAAIALARVCYDLGIATGIWASGHAKPPKPIAANDAAPAPPDVALRPGDIAMHGDYGLCAVLEITHTDDISFARIFHGAGTVRTVAAATLQRIA